MAKRFQKNSVLFFLLLLLGLSAVLVGWWELAGAHRLPFGDMRWKKGMPEILLQGQWHEWLTVGETQVDRLVLRAVARWGPAYQDAFGDNLNELLNAEGESRGVLLRLNLRRGSGIRTIYSWNTYSRWRRYQAARLGRKRISRKRDWISFPDSPLLRRMDGHRPGEGKPWISSYAALADLEQLEYLLSSRYAYEPFSTFDYKAALDTLAAGLGQGITRRDFALQIARLLARFNDLHTRLSFGRSEVLLPPKTFPGRMVWLPEGVACLNDRQTGFLDPDFPLLASINGRAPEDWLSLIRDLVPAPTLAFQRWKASDYLYRIKMLDLLSGRPFSDSINVELLSPDRRRKHILVLPHGSTSPAHPYRQIVDWRILRPGIGYLALRTHLAESLYFEQEIRKALRAMQATKGLILDFRGNTGGHRRIIPFLLNVLLPSETLPLVVNVAAYRMEDSRRPAPKVELLRDRLLFSLSFVDWKKEEHRLPTVFFETFQGNVTSLPTGFSSWHTMVVPSIPQEVSFVGRPIVILHDAVCTSATEILLASLKGQPGITLMGEPSTGGSGYPLPYHLQNSGLVIYLSSMVSFQPNAQFYSGTQPDIPYLRSLENLTRLLSCGEDALIMQAVDLVLSQNE